VHEAARERRTADLKADVQPLRQFARHAGRRKHRTASDEFSEHQNTGSEAAGHEELYTSMQLHENLVMSGLNCEGSRVFADCNTRFACYMADIPLTCARSQE